MININVPNEHKMDLSSYKRYVFIKLYLFMRRTPILTNILDLMLLPGTLLKTDWKMISKYRKYCNNHNYSYSVIDALSCYLKYGTDFDEYYVFKFFKLNDEQRSAYISNRVRHTFARLSNNQLQEYKLNDKYESYKIFKIYMKRSIISLSDLNDIECAVNWVQQRDKFIIKPRFGAKGRNIHLKAGMTKYEDIKAYLLSKLKENKQLLEEVIEQHPETKKFNPDSVNSLRIISYISDGKVIILGALFRMACGGCIDNIATGGVAAPVDIETGIVSGLAVKWDPTDEKYYDKHPTSGINIIDFKIPFWGETVKQIDEMANIISDLKTVAWDVAITSYGPVLIEANTNWGIMIYQLPYKKGRLITLLPFLDKRYLYPAHRKIAKYINWQNIQNGGISD